MHPDIDTRTLKLRPLWAVLQGGVRSFPRSDAERATFADPTQLGQLAWLLAGDGLPPADLVRIARDVPTFLTSNGADLLGYGARRRIADALAAVGSLHSFPGGEDIGHVVPRYGSAT